ncbi:DEAD/DEAH box helicase family protein [Staphylococcus aureus]
MRQTILLYAVTGAGKTEMMFQGIQYARRQGDNIAIVSPRVDVVINSTKPLEPVFISVYCIFLKRKGQKKGRLFNLVCFRVFELTPCPSFLLRACICES